MCLILEDRFWVVHILFVHVVNFKLLVQLSVDHLPHSVVSSVILFLCLFAVFAFYEIDCFVSITT